MSKQEQVKSKIRVYEYAKSLNMSSKEIITILKRLNIPTTNHMSVIEKDVVEKIENYMLAIKENAQKRERSVSSQPQVQASQVKTEIETLSKFDQSGVKTGQQHREQRIQKNSSKKAQRRPEEGSQSRQGRAGQSSHIKGENQSRQGRAGQLHVKGESQSRQGRAGQSSHIKGENQSRQGRAGQLHVKGESQSRQGRAGQLHVKGESQSHQSRAGQHSSGLARFAQGSKLRQSEQSYLGQNQQRQSRNNVDRNHDNFHTGGRSQQRNKKRLDNDHASNVRGPGRRSKNRNKNQQQERREKIDNTPKKIIVRGIMTVGDLAKLLHKDASEVIKKLLLMGIMATINEEVDLNTIQLIASEFKVEVDLKLPVSEDPFEVTEEKDDEVNLVERPAVVTIMGHVDHGKTTLLDAIRKTNVISGEAGGITQHIGAYQIEFNSKRITFLDTPGHEAFTLMRARGAQVTDITIIVIAADDGVMPQTIEAISHAKAANCPIIVAINKIDKPEANVDRIKQELMEHELVPEEWGGDTIFVNVSAKQRLGLEELLEMILLVSEVNEFKANPSKQARGTVIEAELDKGRGPVARVLVQQGTLKVGDAFIAGTCFGRVRAMVNDRGRRLKEARPSSPIEITGLTDVPQAGDMFIAFKDERRARSIAEKRSTMHRQSQLGENTRVTLDDLFKHIKDGKMKELNVIIKGDVQGSVEALRGSLEKIEVEGVRVKIIHSSVGAITESDVILATASSAIVIGFNVRPDTQAKITAEQEKVDIRLHRVIYSIVEEIESAMKGMLDPEYKEIVTGHAEVRNTFKISKLGTIAGCMVTEGKMLRSADIRLIRDGIVIYEGKIDSLKRFKDDAKEVAQGYECGIMIEKYDDMKEGDIIEAFVMETIERK